tara:strand:- start:1042 stop:2652 length:1611 start_codon:yes stop_codon:yes gene_type:complete
MDPPKVFVSYSHDSDEHKKWVENLAFILRKDFGIDVILDTWDLKFGNVLPKFMETLTEADRVLMICTDNYCEKCDQDNRSGVAYEKLLMSAELMKDVYDNTLIQVVRDNEKARLPKFVGVRLYADFRNDAIFYDQIKKLAANIYGVEYAKPTLGRNPFIQGFDLVFGHDGISILPFKMFEGRRVFRREGLIIIAGTINASPCLCVVTDEGEVDKSFGNDGLLSLRSPGVSYGQSGDYFMVNDIVVRQEDILVIPRFDLGQNNKEIARFDYDGNFIGFENFGADQIGCVLFNGTAPIFHGLNENSVIAILDEAGNVRADGVGPALVKLQGGENLGPHWARCHASEEHLYIFGKTKGKQSFIARFTPDGILDEHFGDGGVVDIGIVGGPDRHAFHNQVLTAASQSDGRVLIGGAANEADIVRLLDNGDADESFGEGGLVDFRANYRGVCERLIIHGDNIIVVGTENSGNGISDVFIGRLLPNGQLDASFYGDGFFTVRIKGQVEFRDIFVDNDKLTILCQTDTDSQRHHKAALARVHI